MKLSNDGDMKVVGKVGEKIVFTVEWISNGKVTVNQFHAVKHNNSSDHDESSNDSEVQIASDRIEIKVEITDGDGDKDDSSTDLGKLIKFEDDGPKVTVSANVRGNAVITQDADTIGNTTDMATANFAAPFTVTTDYGTDGASGGVSWSYKLDNTKSQGTDSGMTKDGATIRIFEIDGVIYGSTASANASENTVKNSAVFKISVNSSGTVTLTQYAEIDHDGPGSTGNFASQVEYLASNLVKLIGTATITDGDGDKSSAEKTIDLGGKIGFNDHGPDIDISGATEVVEGSTINGAWTRTTGADDPSSLTITINNGAPTAFSFGVPIVVGSLGSLTINQNGTWSFQSSGNQDNDPTNPQITFALTIKDSDQDTDSDTQTITIKDGLLNPGQSLTLAPDDDNLVGGTTQPDPDFVSGSITFSGSDNLASIVFGDTNSLSNTLTGVPNATNTQIIGYDGPTAVVQLDLTVDLDEDRDR